MANGDEECERAHSTSLNEIELRRTERARGTGAGGCLRNATDKNRREKWHSREKERDGADLRKTRNAGVCASSD